MRNNVKEIIHKLITPQNYLIRIELASLKSFCGNGKKEFCSRKGILFPTFILHDEMIWY